MKLSNETKVGLLAIVAILVMVLGFNFLKGKTLFSKPDIIYAIFKNVGSLEKSNMVKINGLPIGTVYNYGPADKEVNHIFVEIHLTRDVNIPKNSVAFIDGAIVGAAYINIDKGNATEYLHTGDTISTRYDLGLLADLKTQLSPTISRVNETLDSLKIAIGSLSNALDPNTKNNLHDVIANLAISSGELKNILNTQTGALAQSLVNLNSVTANLAKNNDAVTSSIRNVEVTTSKLANSNIDGMVAALQATISELKSTINHLNTNTGTLGLMMNDRQLYDKLNAVASRLNSTALSAQVLLDDIRVHPKRYVNISVFGGKTKGSPLTSPSVIDTLPVRHQ